MSNSGATSELPECFDGDRVQTSIIVPMKKFGLALKQLKEKINTSKNTKKNRIFTESLSRKKAKLIKTKYDCYMSLLAETDAVELVARLIYSESLAANCSEQIEKFRFPIATTIGNRIAIRKREHELTEFAAAKSVVFDIDQFASSLNIYESSKFKEFLCPKDRVGWLRSKSLAQAQLRSLTTPDKVPSQPSSQLSSETPSQGMVHYYLFKHFDPVTSQEKSRLKQFPIGAAPSSTLPPMWVKQLEQMVGVPYDEFRDCIRFYRNLQWK
jgi:hypothetical protein